MTEHIENKYYGCGDCPIDEMTQEFLAILEDMSQDEKLELLEYIKSIL